MSEFTYRIQSEGYFRQNQFEIRLPVRGDMVRLGDILYEVITVIYHADERHNPLVELRRLDCNPPARTEAEDNEA